MFLSIDSYREFGKCINIHGPRIINVNSMFSLRKIFVFSVCNEKILNAGNLEPCVVVLRVKRTT